MTIASLKSELCCGCAVCYDRCPVNAISMKENEEGYVAPVIDAALCIDCGQCAKVCPQMNGSQGRNYQKQSYVCFDSNTDREGRSSSGGMFALIATYILEKEHGVVYGAAMVYENDILQCKHKRIENTKDLHLLQGSKYMQSHTNGIYKQVKDDLKSGRTVLFSGTSCQVAALKRFVGENDYLFTVDLVCHGVPSDKLFRDYIHFVELKNHCRVTNVSFRNKGYYHFGKEDTYSFLYSFTNDKGQTGKKRIPSYKSAFFVLFRNRAGYRQSCYHCKYASLQKPSDITLGDFIPRDNEIKRYGFVKKQHYSSAIINSECGMGLWNLISSHTIATRIPMDEMLPHHGNLQAPSAVTERGRKFLSVYKTGGYENLQKCVIKAYYKSEIIRFIKSLKFKRLF
ncbi:Coenzyme F420 hydrogenase/dehydrogenase, beta subunit C-terminal domain [Parabacteroides distasonis]|jgi:coenzyme F420-reducing hydrogenase beta subunit|uniref:Coenzyme F420 hydrogenase/dehydrogenase, beta subunit C-terminal domain n=1 Tax=Parabacteroides distasonis TaxID=823 RepID=UPI0018A9C866|nr:Coenzyme F420 hydrogenase/dehydrogenase, beta subunit C-terminal domain [Parabacteroides distasonis]MDB9024261.1 Coenzyme F420 hydrogenase/dehydrogenase, beta subunit C-terminal domain [Parabacteroides distasonis]MDB9042553.1 Coenzyme F420 hydrogenase/dehydrogenase, beta subunit C-terminal domain [Parabacteroides distasonis]MDB9093558.1 Coenzyme F420 hydrogenase/dehydrogenase, beta subunit C-terminal domain [Parabacteroides distasonis]MDB9159074.1 Coenzyme F420 hydrogenase/dehydrogenase, bet